MITYLIVTLIVTSIIVSMFFIKPTKKHRNSSVMDEINKNPEFQRTKDLFELMQSLNNDGTDQDEMPGSYGEFGLETSNPIPVNTTFGSTAYLSRLRTLDDKKVSYERIGSVTSQVSKHPVDCYKIKLNNLVITNIYISCYNKRNSEKAPKNFKLN